MVFPSTLIVRQARAGDVDAIEQFIEEGYSQLAPYKIGARWRWQFLNNPYRDRSGEAVPVWIALDGEKVIGQIAVQPTTVKIGEKIHQGGWMVDVLILPRYRGGGLANRLQDAVVQSVPLLLTLTMAPATRRLGARAGAVTLGATRQFTRWVRLSPSDVRGYLLLRLEHRPRLRSIARFACDWLLFSSVFALLGNLWTKPLVLPREPGVEIKEVASFGSETDALWNRVAPRYGALCVRDSKFLNWRFVDSPDLEYRRFLAMAAGRVVGYSVLRRKTAVELRQGVIAEMFADPDDKTTLLSLLSHGVRHFGADVASIECASSRPEIATALRSFGFFPTRETAATCVVADAGLRAEVERLRDDWYFTKGDHDWDQVVVG